MATPSKAFAIAHDPLVEADKAHYMHGYHVFDEHRERDIEGHRRIARPPPERPP